MPGRKWTLKQKKQQAQAIHRWKPWDRSTGPRTPEGKAKSARNALKHGVRSEAVKDFRKVVRENRKAKLLDLAAQEKVEAAREAALCFVAATVNRDDVDAVAEASDFIAKQVSKARKTFLKTFGELYKAARRDVYSIRRPKVKT